MCLVVVRRVGVAPTMFLTCAVYSRVPSLLGIPTHNWRTIEDLNSCFLIRSQVSYPLNEWYTRPIFVSFTCGNRKHTRHCTVHDAALGLVPCFRASMDRRRIELRFYACKA